MLYYKSHSLENRDKDKFWSDTIAGFSQNCLNISLSTLSFVPGRKGRKTYQTLQFTLCQDLQLLIIIKKLP